ncbi:MAG: hypothetical protein WC617_08040 [Rhodanobacter sp.]|jgi:hypothetical protein
MVSESRDRPQRIHAFAKADEAEQRFTEFAAKREKEYLSIG